MTAPRLVDYVIEVVANEQRDNDTLLQPEAELEPKVCNRVPAADHPDFPLPDGLPYFCLPECCSPLIHPPYSQIPLFFSFSLTGGDGSRAYGFALYVPDTYDEAAGQRTSRAFCVISHHPFFSFFRHFLRWLYDDHISNDAPRPLLSSNQTEVSPSDNDLPLINDQVNEVVHLLTTISFNASPGIAIELQNHQQPLYRYLWHRGKAAHLDDACFEVLFQCLSAKNVVYVLNCMLTEQRVLVHTQYPALLTPVCEALCALLFPFRWEHAYAPFLPVQLIEYVQAPVPYLMGVHTSSLAARVAADTFASCVVVHLDKDNIVSPIFTRIDGLRSNASAIPRFPMAEVRKLLDEVTPQVPRPARYVSSGGNQSDASMRLKEIEVVFGDGPLGLSLESTMSDSINSEYRQNWPEGTSTVVKALLDAPDGTPGAAERSGSISPGFVLIGINGVSVLDNTFMQTIDKIRTIERPISLRFFNPAPTAGNLHDLASQYQTLAVSTDVHDSEWNAPMPWVDVTRSAFATFFARILGDFQSFLSSDGQGVSFNRHGYCQTRKEPETQTFLKELVQTQAFTMLIHDFATAMTDVDAEEEPKDVQLFKLCAYLAKEAEDPRTAIRLLFERDATPIDKLTLELANLDEGKAQAVEAEHESSNEDDTVDALSSPTASGVDDESEDALDENQNVE